MREVTYRDFAKLMTKRRRDVDTLVDIFHGKLDENRNFFERVMSCKWQHEDRSDVVIPYRSVIEFYLKEQFYAEDQKKGCGYRKKTGTDG